MVLYFLVYITAEFTTSIMTRKQYYGGIIMYRFSKNEYITGDITKLFDKIDEVIESGKDCKLRMKKYDNDTCFILKVVKKKRKWFR